MLRQGVAAVGRRSLVGRGVGLRCLSHSDFETKRQVVPESAEGVKEMIESQVKKNKVRITLLSVIFLIGDAVHEGHAGGAAVRLLAAGRAYLARDGRGILVGERP